MRYNHLALEERCLIDQLGQDGYSCLHRVLFGSDYYMIEREKTPERELSIRLRSALGRDTFNLIAHHNPILYLNGGTRAGENQG